MDEDEKKEMLNGMTEAMEAMLPFYAEYMPKMMETLMPSMQPAMDAWSKSIAVAIADEFERRGLKA